MNFYVWVFSQYLYENVYIRRGVCTFSVQRRKGRQTYIILARVIYTICTYYLYQVRNSLAMCVWMCTCARVGNPGWNVQLSGQGEFDRSRFPVRAPFIPATCLRIESAPKAHSLWDISVENFLSCSHPVSTTVRENPQDLRTCRFDDASNI